MPGGHGGELLTLLLTIFWIIMLIDCIRNKGLTGGSKLLWFLFILFTHTVGAFIYLIFGRSRHNVQRQQTPPYIYYQPPRRKQQPYYTPPPVQKKEEPYSSYEQGYQVQQQERPASFEGMEQPPVEQPHYNQYDQYEQPQATYPEQAPQEQSQ